MFSKKSEWKRLWTWVRLIIIKINLVKKAKISIFNALNINDLTKICPMISSDKITEIFSIVDEFCKDFDKFSQPYLLGNKPKRKPRMNTSEVITIALLFHFHKILGNHSPFP